MADGGINWNANAQSNTPRALVFDHIAGTAYVRYDDYPLTMSFPLDSPGPLNRAQHWLWKRERGDWLGNRFSDVRYWLWRLSR